jgi:hypothetical protein
MSEPPRRSTNDPEAGGGQVDVESELTSGIAFARERDDD